MYSMPSYSYSRLCTFENCPLQYRYAYVDRVQVEVRDTVEAFMGNMVHKTLFKLYHDMIMSKLNTIDELNEYYLSEWNKGWSDDILIAREGMTPQHYIDSGMKCIRSYYNRYSPFDDSKTVGIEQQIAIDLDGYRLNGYIDRLSRDKHGRLEVHDYKTSHSAPAPSSVDTRQLALYQIGVETRWKSKDVDLIWHYLLHDIELRMTLDEYEKRSIADGLVDIIKNIETADTDNDYPARTGPLCRWCAYAGICEAVKDQGHTIADKASKCIMQ